MFRHPFLIAIAAFAFFAFSAPLFAQDVPAMGDTISADDLELTLKPLTAEELQAAADEWIGKLQAASKAHSDALIASGGAADAAVDSAAAARDALAEKVNVVIAALKEKGGDV